MPGGFMVVGSKKSTTKIFSEIENEIEIKVNAVMV